MLRVAVVWALLGLAARCSGQGGGPEAWTDETKCDDVFLGPEIGWVNIFNYNDREGTCSLSMPELAMICKDHYAQCMQFIESSNTKAKDGAAACGQQKMEEAMAAGGDVCCDYTDGRLCGTFPTSGMADTAEECADTGEAGPASELLRMPLSRTCDKWVVAMRFPHANFPRNAALDEAYILLPVPPNANEQGPVNLRIFVEAADSSAALSGAAGDLMGRPRSSFYVDWSPPDWQHDMPVEMTPDISSLLAALSTRVGWQPGNAVTFFVEPAGDEKYNRIVQKFDVELQMPALRVVWHDDESVSRSIDEYQAGVGAVNAAKAAETAKASAEAAAAENQGSSTGEVLLVALLASLLTAGGCMAYNRKYGTTWNGRLFKDSAQLDAQLREQQGLADSEGNVSSDDEDAVDEHGNPVAKAYTSEGLPRGFTPGPRSAQEILFGAAKPKAADMLKVLKGKAQVAPAAATHPPRTPDRV